MQTRDTTQHIFELFKMLTERESVYTQIWIEFEIKLGVDFESPHKKEPTAEG